MFSFSRIRIGQSNSNESNEDREDGDNGNGHQNQRSSRNSEASSANLQDIVRTHNSEGQPIRVVNLDPSAIQNIPSRYERYL